MSDGLRIGSLGERLPLEAAAARHVALSKSGFGKSNLSAVIAEELYRNSIPFALADPLGKMHGLRSSADGEREGLQIAVLGGRAGDVALRADRGAYVADLLLEGVSAVLDFSAMLDDEYCGFMADFLERLSAAADHVVHIIFEESERFMPERARKGEHARLKQIMGRFARECRNFGVGFTASTQRPQLMDKNVIDSAEIIYAMKLTGDLAQDAIGAEASSRCGKEIAKKILADVPNLQKGEAWLIPDDESIWGVPRRLRFRLRETFEIRPPRIGEAVRAPRVLAAVDLEQLREAMSESEAAGDETGDVAGLRARIADLEARELERVEVAVLPPEIATELRAWSTEYEAIVERAQAVAEAGNAIADRIVMALNATERAPNAPGSTSTVTDGPEVDADLNPYTNTKTPRSTDELSKGAIAIVETLVARHPAKFTRGQVATLSGRSIKSSSFWPHVSEGIDAGLIERTGDGRLGATNKAVKAFGHVRPASATDIRERWLNAMPTPGARRMLEEIIKARGPLTREQWAELAGVSLTSSALAKHISTIVDNGLAARRSDGTYVAFEFLIERRSR